MEPKPNQLNHRGMALVLVLVFVVLITGLLMAFFLSAKVELSASSSYLSGITSKQLAESAVNVAMGQIKMATAGTSTNGTALAWASQPGMIRTYDDSGSKLAYYKLYSSSNMVVAQGEIAAFDFTNDLKVKPSDAVTAWANQPAIFTDLNAPFTSSGVTTYPIVDPSAVVDGFALSGSNNPAVSGSGANLAPMPVKWIYVLKNGAITAPTGVDATGKIATWSGSAESPSATNPIVGRIAFWTDDESCKLNLNTASEPTPWASPMAVSKQDVGYALYQPGKNEYQRYPGHPFTVALSPVLFPGLSGNLTAAQMEAIYKFSPRVQWGGSKAGTIAITNNSTGTAFSAVTPDQDRLFANIDEAIFASGPTGPARAENSSVAGFRDILQKARFFLTANSRAPEVNLFGQPRISLWPVYSGSSHWSPFDKLATFCSTIGGKAYYFQRWGIWDCDYDYSKIPRNQELYKYLQNLTGKAIPGFGGDFKTKWGDDRDQVLTEMFDYIRSVNLRDPFYMGDPALNAANKRGYVAPIKITNGGTSTQGFGRFSTISQFGLHFICSATANATGAQQGVLDANTPALTSNQSAVEVSFLFEPFCVSMGFPQAQMRALYVVTFKNAGKLDGHTLFVNSDGSLVTGIGEDYFGQSQFLTNATAWGGTQGIRAPIFILGYQNGHGSIWGSPYEYLYPYISKRVTVGGTEPDGTAKKTMEFDGCEVEVKVYAGSGGFSAVAPQNLVQTFTMRFPPATLPIPQLVNLGTAATPGAAVTKREDWWSFRSWSGNMSSPPAVPGSGNSRYVTQSYPFSPGLEYTDTKRRWSGSSGFFQGSVFRKEDVVRTMVPDHGDIRLIAATANVGSAISSFGTTQFIPGNNYFDSTVKFDHIFSEGRGPHFLFGFSNEPGADPAGTEQGTGFTYIKGTAADDQLVPSSNIQYHYSRLPEIRPGAGKLSNQWNDFDNGFAAMTDGAYINRPDEGTFSDIKNPATDVPGFNWTQTYLSSATQTDLQFSPCRFVPSAGMFGSLPTGVKRHRPWETLLFRPPNTPSWATGTHPGATSPKDHLIMDLFWMPAVDPYAISEPFSTAGKINLNYQIAPFTYIRRATGLYGAFKSEEPLVIPNTASKIYKLWDNETGGGKFPSDSSCQDPQVNSDWTALRNGAAPFNKMRLPIDMSETLKQADDRFDGIGAYDARFSGNPDIFRSATEICELHLVRKGESLDDYTSGKIWANALLTGDNTRERPYTNLYAKLTTRSNIYSVHFRVQQLKKSSASDQTQWDEAKDQVLGEYRGSSMIERYVDASDPKLVDFATVDRSLDAFYKFRVLSTRKFP